LFYRGFEIYQKGKRERPQGRRKVSTEGEKLQNSEAGEKACILDAGPRKSDENCYCRNASQEKESRGTSGSEEWGGKPMARGGKGKEGSSFDYRETPSKEKNYSGTSLLSHSDDSF